MIDSRKDKKECPARLQGTIQHSAYVTYTAAPSGYYKMTCTAPFGNAKQQA